MIRLITIRFFESISRNILVIIIPAIIITLIVILVQLTQKPRYLSEATIQIRYNSEISKVIGYAKFRTHPKDPAQRMIWELQELMQTDTFVDKLIERVDFDDQLSFNSGPQSQHENRDYIRDNVQFVQTGVLQIDIAVKMPTATSSVAIINTIYDEYLNHQVGQFGKDGRNLINHMGVYLDAKNQQRDRINQELYSYLETHPKHPFFGRREVEEMQIAQLITARDDLSEEIEKTEDILDLGYLVEGTSERYFKETFVLIDAPFDPIPLSTPTKKFLNIIIGALVGSMIGFAVMSILIIFDRRIILPLDLQNTTDIPLLAIVAIEKKDQNQQGEFDLRHQSTLPTSKNPAQGKSRWLGQLHTQSPIHKTAN